MLAEFRVLGGDGRDRQRRRDVGEINPAARDILPGEPAPQHQRRNWVTDAVEWNQHIRQHQQEQKHDENGSNRPNDDTA
jgi:hypothetical protein